MFLAILTYKKPIEDIEKFLPEHIQYLDQHYKSNNFIFSGRRNPRVGGVILMNAITKENAWAIIQKDPFYQNELADYEVIEFTPTKYDPKFASFMTENPLE